MSSSRKSEKKSAGLLGSSGASEPYESSGTATAVQTPDPALQETSPDDDYPHGIPLFLICLGLLLAALCVSLDRSIVATAVPKITTEFNSLPDIGWYGSAYLLTSCCFQLMYGKLFAEVDVKWFFLIALSTFEVGSIVCASAPSSAALVVGRTVAGLGASGILTGALTILAQSVPLHSRPKYIGAIGGCASIAQAIGPTLGGVLTDYATWRWCFWINLPIGAITLATVFFLVHLPPKINDRKETLLGALQKFDLLGNLSFIPSLASLLLALEWGGGKYQWSNWRIILLLSIFGVGILIWGVIQFLRGDKATLPLRIVKMRSMAACLWFVFNLMGLMYIYIAYVAVWFQTVRNVSAFQSGVDFLAVTIPQAVTVIAAGFITGVIGYYVPGIIASSVLCSVASGLIFRFSRDTSTAYWIGSLVLLGIGFGIGGQQPMIVVQTVLKGGDVAIGTSVAMFCITMSGTIFYSVGNNVLQDRLIAELGERVPEVDPFVVINAGANKLVAAMEKVYPQYVDGILDSYEAALQRVSLISVLLACLSTVGAVFVEWKSVKKAKPAPATIEQEVKDEPTSDSDAPGSRSEPMSTEKA